MLAVSSGFKCKPWKRLCGCITKVTHIMNASVWAAIDHCWRLDGFSEFSWWKGLGEGFPTCSDVTFPHFHLSDFVGPKHGWVIVLYVDQKDLRTDWNFLLAYCVLLDVWSQLSDHLVGRASWGLSCWELSRLSCRYFSLNSSILSEAQMGWDMIIV